MSASSRPTYPFLFTRPHYKGGYTDHLGKFDYASVSTPEMNPIERFAILVLSEEQGALIREAPPAQ